MSLSGTDARFRQMILKPERLTVEDTNELRTLLSQVSYACLEPTQVGRAQLRSILDLTDAIRDFDRASGEMVRRGNRINTWVLVFAIIAAILAGASVWISWLYTNTNQ